MLISDQIQSRSALHILGFLIEFALSIESLSNMLPLLRVSFHQPLLNSFALYTQPFFLLSFILPWELLLSGFSGPSFPASLEMGWQQGQIRDVLGERLEQNSSSRRCPEPSSRPEDSTAFPKFIPLPVKSSPTFPNIMAVTIVPSKK